MNPADCYFVDAWLDDWLAGRLPVDVGRRVDAHLRECERCRQLAAIVRDGVAPGGSEEDADAGADGDLFEAVLSRTSGNPCRQAEPMLPALVDGELDATSRQIVSSHLEHCSACAELAAALREAREVLPWLAEVEPPPGFTSLVLARTSRAPRRSLAAEWWKAVLLRPRASLELAYVATVLIVVLVGNPVIAFRGAEEHARRLVGSVPVDRIAAELPAREAAVGIIASTFGPLMSTVRAIGIELSNQWLQVKAIASGAWDAMTRAASWVRTLDWKAVFKSAAPSSQPGNKSPPKKDAR